MQEFIFLLKIKSTVPREFSDFLHAWSINYVPKTLLILPKPTTMQDTIFYRNCISCYPENCHSDHLRFLDLFRTPEAEHIAPKIQGRGRFYHAHFKTRRDRGYIENAKQILESSRLVLCHCRLDSCLRGMETNERECKRPMGLFFIGTRGRVPTRFSPRLGHQCFSVTSGRRPREDRFADALGTRSPAGCPGQGFFTGIRSR